MKLDDEVCLCFHVTRRKVHQYIRVTCPAVASQLSECFGAGTGCGWCRPYLERIFNGEASQSETRGDDELPEMPELRGLPELRELPELRGLPELPGAAQYAQARGIYRASKKTPSSEP